MGVAWFLTPEAFSREAVVVHGKDRTPQCCTRSTAQVVVWRVGGQKVQEKREQGGSECAARGVVAVGQGKDLPEVPV